MRRWLGLPTPTVPPAAMFHWTCNTAFAPITIPGRLVNTHRLLLPVEKDSTCVSTESSASMRGMSNCATATRPTRRRCWRPFTPVTAALIPSTTFAPKKRLVSPHRRSPSGTPFQVPSFPFVSMEERASDWLVPWNRKYNVSEAVL